MVPKVFFISYILHYQEDKMSRAVMSSIRAMSRKSTSVNNAHAQSEYRKLREALANDAKALAKCSQKLPSDASDRRIK
jgi:aspartate/glutamate racemase